MSLGKPCVVTDAGGNPEIVKHQVTGLVTSNDDLSSFAEAITTLVRDADLRNAMSNESLCRFEQNFSAVSLSHHYQHLYNQIRNR